MNRFSLSPGAILVLALIYFFGGFKNLAAIITAVSVHEAGHAAAISIFGGKVKTLRFDYSGLCMSGFGAYSSACEVINTSRRSCGRTCACTCFINAWQFNDEWISSIYSWYKPCLDGLQYASGAAS